MARTPEAAVKEMVKAFLIRHDAHYFMPVQNGMGAMGLDFHCIAYGHAFFIETKAPGNHRLTPRQKVFADTVKTHGAPVFVVSEPHHLDAVEDWICQILLSRSG